MAGDHWVRWRGPRDIRPESSWVTRFDGFDQPYAIDPTDEFSVRAADDALDAAQAGRPWDLVEARFIPSRPAFLRRPRG